METKVIAAKEWGNRVRGCERVLVKVEELKKNREKTGASEHVESGI